MLILLKFIQQSNRLDNYREHNPQKKLDHRFWLQNKPLAFSFYQQIFFAFS